MLRVLQAPKAKLVGVAVTPVVVALPVDPVTVTVTEGDAEAAWVVSPRYCATTVLAPAVRALPGTERVATAVDMLPPLDRMALPRGVALAFAVKETRPVGRPVAVPLETKAVSVVDWAEVMLAGAAVATVEVVLVMAATVTVVEAETEEVWKPSPG